MKGVETAGGASMSMGRGASRGALGPSRSISVSLSSEALRSGGKSAFSKGPSLFKETPSQKSSILNTNFGRERISPVARSISLAKTRGMFDRARPHVPQFGGEKRTGVKSAGRMFETRSPGSRTEAFRSISLQRMDARQPINIGKTEAPRKVNPFTDTVILWKNPNKQIGKRVEARNNAAAQIQEIRAKLKTLTFEKPNIRIDTNVTSRENVRPRSKAYEQSNIRSRAERVKKQSYRPIEIRTARITEARPIVYGHRHVEGQRVSQQQPRTETPITQRELQLKEFFVMAPTVKPERMRVIELDIKAAQKMITLVMDARKITRGEAQRTMHDVLAKKFATEPGVKVTPIVDAQPQAVVEVVPAKKLQTEQKNNPETDGKKKRDEGEKKSGNMIQFYYERDERANANRVSRAVKAMQHLLAYRKPEDTFPTGADVAYQMKDATEQEKSEVVKFFHGDGSRKGFVEAIARLKEFGSLSAFQAEIEGIISKISAIRLVLQQTPDLAATESMAEDVFEKPLHNVDAHFEENAKSDGRLVKDKNGHTWYIPNGQLIPIQSA